MIIINCIGGLGNQMFQYALGRALALRKGAHVCLDAGDFSRYPLRNYELETVFSIKLPRATQSDIYKTLGLRASVWIRRLLLKKRFSEFRGEKLIVEPQISYWPPILSIPADCYLIGHWVSEKYFMDFQNEIRADLSFKNPLSGLNAELAKRMANCESVSLHVRRGDMAQNPDTMAVHGLCSPRYYRQAIKHIAGLVRNPEIFIFSDDIGWAKSNLDTGVTSHYVAHNTGVSSFYDMHLMSLCKHNIIANSTFSWWGAWLNRNPDKIVVAPQRWFAADLDSSDIIPNSWFRIDDSERGGLSGN